MLSITLDSNQYISALNFGGPPLQVIDLARAGLVRLDVSDAILDEVAGVLRDKFHWREADIADVQQEIRSLANYVTPVEAISVVREDPADDRILECAVAARSDYLITGDKHLLKLVSHGGILIVKAAEFLVMARGR